jgi:hypothetical protein
MGLLDLASYALPAVLGLLGAYVTFWSPQEKHKRYWFAAFAVFTVIGVGIAAGVSRQHDKELRAMITGGDSYAYLFADKGDLASRKSQIRLWVCSTGDIFFLAIHTYPYKSKTDDPAYVSIPGAGFAFLSVGCGWSGIIVPPGKYSVDLRGRNRTVREIFEITQTKEGGFNQTCGVLGDNREKLSSPMCEGP